MDLSFFTTDNVSGYKTRESWFSKNHVDEYSKINEYCSKINIDLNFKEKIWFYYNQINERPKCKTCGGEIKFRNRFDTPYGDFCSLNCINNNKDEMIRRQKKTFNEKYNIDFYPQHKDFVIKQKESKNKKYGNGNYNNIEKQKKTKLDKYGNENYNNIEKQKKTSLLLYGVNNYSKSKKYKEDIIENFKLIYPNKLFLKINKYDVDILCEKCKNSYNITKQNLYERSKRNYETCTFCNPIGQSTQSGYEDEICQFLDELKTPYTRTNKILENNKEIDIILTDFNIGIEFNGLYWHNELFLSNDYHLNKTIQSNKIGIELIHIFEDEWIYKKEIIKSIIKNRTNQTNNLIYGRKCIIKYVNQKESTEFLNNNHIQGNVNSKIRIGLYYENKLVSLMTFSKGRVIMGGKKDEWELNRFCNIINYNVIGGADKLLKFFIKNHNPKKIISYSDKRIFNGNMYKKLGFIEKNHSKPNYWYVINNKRYHRFNFRKSQLVKEGFDNNKTEKQIMFDRKIYRIYDCGNIRWESSVFIESIQI